MLPVETPFKTYTDLEGKPLDSGYIYFGVANQNPVTSPITVYWDAAGTIPAAQPLRTVDGYIIRGGTPANVYTDQSYSELALDHKKRQVFFARNSEDFSLAYVVGQVQNGLAALKTGTEFVVQNMAALVALDSTKYSTVSMLGYYSAGDGGGGVYYKLSTPPSGGANAGSVVQCADASYWSLSQVIPVSIRQFGAKGDGTTDDTVAVQKFINYAISTRCGYIPATVSAYRCTAPIQVVGSLFVYGDGCIPYQAPQSGAVRNRGRGSWFFFDHTGVGFNLNNTNETTEVKFQGIGTVRNQPAPTTGWAPIACDYDFYCAQVNGDYTFKDIYLLNANKGIYANGRCTFDNVRGQCFTVGIYANFCADTCRYTDFHLWPYWSDDPSVKAYMLANTTALQFLRSDNPLVDRCFSIWCRSFITVSEGVNGGVSKLRISNSDGDSGVFFLYVDATVVNGATIQVSNCSSQGDSVADGSIGIYVQGSGCRINVSNYSPATTKLNSILIGGTANRIQISNFRADFWNVVNGGFPAIQALTGNQVHIEAPFDYDGGNGAKLLDGAAQFFGRIGGGNYSGTTDGAGLLIVPHTMGAQPSRVVCQLIAPDAGITIRVVSTTGTTFTIQCYRANVAYASGAVQLTYDAFDINR